jgi:hydroxymethylbilane synthase
MPSRTHLRIGTRGSALALVQAEATEALLREAFPDLTVERVIIRTTGDRRTDVALAQVAKAEGIFDKGVFIKELEQALDDGTIDIAVHSLKDVPTVLDPRFSLAATLERAPIRDVWVSPTPGGLAALPAGARVGTSSVRRARQVHFLRPDLIVTDLRGNVPTRLEKIAAGNNYEAILLAEAGLVRLGYLEHHSGTIPATNLQPLVGFPSLHATLLPEHEFYPAAGQGAIGLETRAKDEESQAIARAIHHASTWLRITAEREFLRLLDAGCHTPVGVYSSLEQGRLTLAARVFPEHEGPPVSGHVHGTDPWQTAQALYLSLS